LKKLGLRTLTTAGSMFHPQRSGAHSTRTVGVSTGTAGFCFLFGNGISLRSYGLQPIGQASIDGCMVWETSLDHCSDESSIIPIASSTRKLQKSAQSSFCTIYHRFQFSHIRLSIQDALWLVGPPHDPGQRLSNACHGVNVTS
jgi:hypothetical protein